jgi:hypothetical protein
MVRYLNTTKTSYLDGDILYSYNTPVAKVVGHELLVDDVYYSVTTSKQITLASRKLCLNKVKVSNLFNR